MKETGLRLFIINKCLGNKGMVDSLGLRVGLFAQVWLLSLYIGQISTQDTSVLGEAGVSPKTEGGTAAEPAPAREVVQQTSVCLADCGRQS